MSTTPFFSIIIPTYNRANILPRAIQSVLDQEFTDWELIIVDDGSVDDTKTVIASFLDKRIRYYWQENRELNGARNTGIRLAKGQYLAFLDDDDLYLKKHLLVLYSHIAKNQSDVNIFRTGMLLESKLGAQKGMLYDNIAPPVYFLWHHPVNLLSFAFHRSVFEELKFDEQFLLGDDFHFLMQLFLKRSFVQIDTFTVVYHLHETNRTNEYFQKHHLDNKLKAMDLLWDKCGDELSEHISKHLLNGWKANQTLHFARTAFRHGEKKLGWFYYTKALNGFSLHYSKAFLRTAVLGLFGV